MKAERQFQKSPFSSRRSPTAPGTHTAPTPPPIRPLAATKASPGSGKREELPRSPLHTSLPAQEQGPAGQTPGSFLLSVTHPLVGDQ